LATLNLSQRGGGGKRVDRYRRKLKRKKPSGAYGGGGTELVVKGEEICLDMGSNKKIKINGSQETFAIKLKKGCLWEEKPVSVGVRGVAGVGGGGWLGWAASRVVSCGGV